MLLVLLVLPAHLVAQSLGGRIGIAVPEEQPRFTVGSYFAVPVGHNVNLQAELLYFTNTLSFTGYTQDIIPSSGQAVLVETTDKWQSSYLHIPILVTLERPLLFGLAFDVVLGPSAVLQVRCQHQRAIRIYDLDDARLPNPPDTETECNNAGLDFGFTAGGGVRHVHDNIEISFNLRHRTGLVNVNPNLRNHMFALTLGVGITR
jgi:hypothetical protein